MYAAIEKVLYCGGRNRRAAVEEQSCVLFSIAALLLQLFYKRAAVEEAFLLRPFSTAAAAPVAAPVRILPQLELFYANPGQVDSRIDALESGPLDQPGHLGPLAVGKMECYVTHI